MMYPAEHESSPLPPTQQVLGWQKASLCGGVRMKKDIYNSLCYGSKEMYSITFSHRIKNLHCTLQYKQKFVVQAVSLCALCRPWWPKFLPGISNGLPGTYGKASRCFLSLTKTAFTFDRMFLLMRVGLLNTAVRKSGEHVGLV